MEVKSLSLEGQLAEFQSRKFLAMPIAGSIAWLAIGITGCLTSHPFTNAMSVFIGTGVIFYLALFIARLTGEDLLGRNRPRNVIDYLFLLTVFQAIAAYAIAIPFFMVERSSLPLSVGILTGLMWIPFSGLIQHWLGVFHAVARTGLIVTLWYLFPDLRYIAIPFAIVGVYWVTIGLLLSRKTSIAEQNRGHVELASEA